MSGRSGSEKGGNKDAGDGKKTKGAGEAGSSAPKKKVVFAVLDKRASSNTFTADGWVRSTPNDVPEEDDPTKDYDDKDEEKGDVDKEKEKNDDKQEDREEKNDDKKGEKDDDKQEAEEKSDGKKEDKDDDKQEKKK